ncbi:NUDIX hydrolase [Flindersiella endophytica]
MTPLTPLRRFTARALPVNSEGRVLLLNGFDPHRPDEPFWFTVGGAAEDGETLQEAAMRELHEEAGILVQVEEFSESLGTSTVEFSFGPYAITQDQTFFAVRVGDAEVSFDHMEPIEKDTTLGYRWWNADELEASDVTYPPELPDVIRKATGTV